MSDVIDAHDLGIAGGYIIEAEMQEVIDRLEAENAKLLEQLERVQPTDCEGNALDIADTVHMLRSEYDGDHEWEDVVTELVLTKWGGDRWIVRGSKGEAWACDCTKTGYDEDAYEAADDVEPFGEPTLLEVENAKLRQQVTRLQLDWESERDYADQMEAKEKRAVTENAKLRELCGELASELRGLGVDFDRFVWCGLRDEMRELGVEVPE